jgi:hypothetical protein
VSLLGIWRWAKSLQRITEDFGQGHVEHFWASGRPNIGCGGNRAVVLFSQAKLARKVL